MTDAPTFAFDGPDGGDVAAVLLPPATPDIRARLDAARAKRIAGKVLEAHRRIQEQGEAATVEFRADDLLHTLDLARLIRL